MELLKPIALQAKKRDAAQAALGKLADSRDIEEVAKQSGFSEVRLAAVARLNSD